MESLIRIARHTMRNVADLAIIEDVVLPDSDGTEVRFGDLWLDQPVVIAWLRHYG